MEIQQLLYRWSPKSEKWHSVSSPSWNIKLLLCSYSASRVGLFVFVGFCEFFVGGFVFFFFPAGWISLHINLCLQITDAVLLSSGFVSRRHFKKPGCGYAECYATVLVAAVFSESAGKQLLVSYLLLGQRVLTRGSFWLCETGSFAGDCWTDTAFPICWKATSASSCHAIWKVLQCSCF